MTELAGKLLKDIYAAIPRQNDLIRVVRRERTVAANWKTVINNNHRCYHCAVNHKSLMELVDYDNKADWSDDGITFTRRHGGKEEPRQLGLQARRGHRRAGRAVRLHLSEPRAAVVSGAGRRRDVPDHSDGAEHQLVRHDFYFPTREITPERQEFMDWITNRLLPEDQVLFERVQKGLHSKGYRQGKFVVDRDHPEFSEHHVHFFQRHVYEAMVGER